MEGARKQPQSSQDQADGYVKAKHGQAHGLAAGTPDAQMAHGLKSDGIKSGCKRCQVVGDEKNLNGHTGGEDQHRQDEEADAAVEENAADHEHGQQQRQAGIKLEASDDFQEGLGKKTGD